MFFFFNDENKSDDKQIELHYLSNSISYGVDKNNEKKFFDSHGMLEKQDSKDGSQNEFKEGDFKRLISEKICKTIYGEKYSNIVFLAGAGASVVGGNLDYGKTVKMIADDIFEKLHKIDELYTLEELAEMCRYKDGKAIQNHLSENQIGQLKKLNTGEAILTSINLLKDLYISVEKCNRVHHNETPSLLRTSF